MSLRYCARSVPVLLRNSRKTRNGQAPSLRAARPLSSCFRLAPRVAAFALLMALLLSACGAGKFRLESVNGDISMVRGRIQRPLSAGTSLREGDVIETGAGGAIVSIGAGERFKVYPRSMVVLRGDPQSWWPRAGHWLSRMKAIIAGFGEPPPCHPGWLPVIAVRG